LSEPISARLEQVFRAVFSLSNDTDIRQVRQINTRKWDSLGHVLLISAIESEFNTQIDVAQTVNLTSFESVELYLSEVLVE
jgi:acyl carrier protein